MNLPVMLNLKVGNKGKMGFFFLPQKGEIKGTLINPLNSRPLNFGLGLLKEGTFTPKGARKLNRGLNPWVPLKEREIELQNPQPTWGKLGRNTGFPRDLP